MDFRLEGNPFSCFDDSKSSRGADWAISDRIVDMDSLYVDYSLLGFARHGVSHLLQNVEVRSAHRSCLNPARAPPRKPRPKTKTNTADAFPERIRLADATLIIRNSRTILSLDMLTLI